MIGPEGLRKNQGFMDVLTNPSNFSVFAIVAGRLHPLPDEEDFIPAHSRMRKAGQPEIVVADGWIVFEEILEATIFEVRKIVQQISLNLQHHLNVSPSSITGFRLMDRVKQ